MEASSSLEYASAAAHRERSLKEVQRKIAKAILSPGEEEAETTSTDGLGADQDVYDVVERYKNELEHIISTLAPTLRKPDGSRSTKTSSASSEQRQRSRRKTQGDLPNKSPPHSYPRPSTAGGRKPPAVKSAWTEHEEEEEIQDSNSTHTMMEAEPELDERELRRYQEDLYKSAGQSDAYYYDDDGADARIADRDRNRVNEVEERVFNSVSEFGKQIDDFKEKVQGGPPTVEANLTKDYFFQEPEEGEEVEVEVEVEVEEDEQRGILKESASSGRSQGGFGKHEIQLEEEMEGFGAAGSAELDSRSYDYDAVARNGRHGHPRRHIAMEEDVHNADQSGQVSVNAVELDAIQEELQGLREWKQNAEESISRLHHQLAISHQAVFDLTEKMRVIIDEQKSLRLEVQTLTLGNGMTMTMARESTTYNSQDDEHVSLDKADANTLRRTARSRDRETNGEMHPDYEEEHHQHFESNLFKARQTSDLPKDPAPALQKYIEEMRASTMTKGKIVPQQTQKKVHRKDLRKTKKSKAAKVGSTSTGHGQPPLIIDRVPKSLEGALEAVHALRPFDGGMSAPSSQLQGPLDMGEMLSHTEDNQSQSDSHKSSEELDRQWSLDHYLSGERERALREEERLNGIKHGQDQGRSAEEIEIDVDRSYPPSTHPQHPRPHPQMYNNRDSWLEERLAALDQEFHSMQEYVDADGNLHLQDHGKDGKDGEYLSTKGKTKSKVASSPKKKKKVGKKKKYTFAEGISSWKSGLRGGGKGGGSRAGSLAGREPAQGAGVGHANRPRSATVKRKTGTGTGKNKSKSRPTTASRYMKGI